MAVRTDFHELKAQATGDDACGICGKYDIFGSSISWFNHISNHAHKICYESISKFEKALQEKVSKVYKKVDEQNLARQKIITQVMAERGGETIASYIKRHGEDSLIALLNAIKIKADPKPSAPESAYAAPKLADDTGLTLDELGIDF
jgi:hypothetical protein